MTTAANGRRLSLHPPGLSRSRVTLAVEPRRGSARAGHSAFCVTPNGSRSLARRARGRAQGNEAAWPGGFAGCDCRPGYGVQEPTFPHDRERCIFALMALQFSVSRVRRRVDAFASGGIVLTDVARYIEDRVAVDAYSFDQCIDLRSAELLDDAEVVRRAVFEERDHQRLGPLPPTAVVATPGTALEAAARAIASAMAEKGVPIAVFHTLVQAEGWLERRRIEASGSSGA